MNEARHGMSSDSTVAQRAVSITAAVRYVDSQVRK